MIESETFQLFLYNNTGMCKKFMGNRVKMLCVLLENPTKNLSKEKEQHLFTTT